VAWALYCAAPASATVVPASFVPTLTNNVVITAEGGGAIYLFARNPPMGFAWGGRVDVPIIWGFGLAAGYQGAHVKHETFPMVTHHPYLALVYRVDDLPLVIPYGELGAGLLFMVSTARPNTSFLMVGHFGGGIDFKLGPVVVGVTVRYHIYLEQLSVPGGIALGLRVGFRFWE
jgi:hypothetical protein